MERACIQTHLLETNDTHLEIIPPELTPKIFAPGIVSDLNWVETTHLRTKNVLFGCTSIENKIYVVGGTVGGNPNCDSYLTIYEGEIIPR